MSMVSNEVASTRPTFAPYWGNRSRISWGAVLAGAIVAVATSILLSLLGAAMGAGSIRPLDSTSTELAHYGIGAAIWQIINLALSMAFGGYVASRLSGTHSHLDGELHGVTMWAVAVLLGSVLLAHAVGGLAGIIGQGASSVVSRAVGDAGTIPGVSSAVGDTGTTSGVIDRLEQSLSNSGDPTTMNREQIGAEIATLVRTSLRDGGSLSDPDRNRLVALVAAQSGVTNDEAARRVTRMENDVKARLSQVEQSASAAADDVVRDTTTAARALFPALVLGLLGALVGSWIGTRHKRVLHPVVEQAYPMQHDVTGAAFERVRPSSVSVYDDRDHLVHQYLRGFSFPMNKQELLRLVRSRGNAGAGLLHSIEDMPEGSYANADEVFRALHIMAH
jgi:hypothetical protein